MKAGRIEQADLKKKIPSLSVKDVYDEMRTCAEGLTQEAAAERLKQYGLNQLQEAKRKPLYQKLLANFTLFFFSFLTTSLKRNTDSTETTSFLLFKVTLQSLG